MRKLPQFSNLRISSRRKKAALADRLLTLASSCSTTRRQIKGIWQRPHEGKIKSFRHEPGECSPTRGCQPTRAGPNPQHEGNWISCHRLTHKLSCSVAGFLPALSDSL